MQKNFVAGKTKSMLDGPQHKNGEPRLVLSAKEVAARLQISIKHLYKMISEGNGPPVKRLGKKYGYRFPVKKFEEWAEKTESK